MINIFKFSFLVKCVNPENSVNRGCSRGEFWGFVECNLDKEMDLV